MAQPKNFLVDIDLNKNQLLNFKYQNLAAHPDSTGWAGINLGFTYWNTTDKKAYSWDGTGWTASGYVAPNHTGDVTSVGDGVTTISADAVTNAKLANMGANTIKGAVGAGDPQDLTPAQVRTMLNVADGAQVNVATNLGQANRTTSALDITSSTGASTTLPIATQTLAGLLSGADKTKLDNLVGNIQSNLSLGTITATTLPILNSDGTGVTLPVAVATTAAGLLSGADKAKLDGIAAGAQVNVATNLALGVLTGTTVPITNSNGTGFTLPQVVAAGNAGVMSGADKTKLDGIAAGAQVNVATNLGYTQNAANNVITSSTGTSATIVLATTALAGLLDPADKVKINKVVMTDSADASLFTGFVSTATDLGAGAAANTKLATQLAIKTYVDNLVLTNGSLVYKGGYDAATNSPLLDATPIAGIKKGWTYVATTAGTFFTTPVEAGDMLIAIQDTPTLEAHWTVVNKNIPDVLTTVLAGFTVGANSTILNSDSILGAFGKVQGQLNAKEGTIAAGTTAQYYRGDKTWQTLNTSAVPESGNLYFTTARVLATALAGFAGATGAVTAADTVLSAFGKLQQTKADLASPALTGTPTAPTPVADDNSTKIATTAFVQTVTGGYLTKATTGGTVTLTATEAASAIINITGALTSNAIIVVPNTTNKFIVENNTTGAFTVQVKTSAGTGPVIAQGYNANLFSDGTNIQHVATDITDINLAGNVFAPTQATGDNSTKVATTAFVKSLGYSTTTGTVRKAIATIGDGTALGYTVNHSWGADVIAQARMASDNSVVECEIIIGATFVTFNFNVAPTAGMIKVVILG